MCTRSLVPSKFRLTLLNHCAHVRARICSRVMTRWLWALLVSGVLLLALMVGGWMEWKKIGRQEAATAFSALAVCLVGGPEPVAAEEASRKAYLLHHEKEDPTLAACIPYRDALAKSRYVRHEFGRLAVFAEDLDLGPFTSKPQWYIEEFWKSAQGLPWQPPATLGETPIAKTPVVLIESAFLEACGNSLAAHPVQLDSRLDPYPPERVILAKNGDFDVFAEDAAGKPLARVTRVRREKHSEPGYLVLSTDKTYQSTRVEGMALWSDGRRLHATRLRDKFDIILHESAETWQEMRSCRATTRRIVAFEMGRERTIYLYALQDEKFVAVGKVDRNADVAPAGRIGSWSMDCDDDNVRIAWAMSEPTGRADPDLGGAVQIPRGGHQQIVVATCTQGNCAQTKTRIELQVGWSSLGGFGSSWVMEPVPVYALGKNVLLFWEGSGESWYRLAPLEELGRTPNTWFAEFLGPKRSDDERSCALTDVKTKILTRRGVALVNVILQQEVMEFGVAARFDGDGNAEAFSLLPPAL